MVRDFESRLKRLEKDTAEDEVVQIVFPPGWGAAYGGKLVVKRWAGEVKRDRVFVIGKGYQDR